jgi:hypothetical protein
MACFKYGGPSLARTLKSFEFLSPEQMTWLDPRKIWKKLRLVVDKLEILEKSQDTKHSDTPIRHLCPTAIQRVYARGGKI